MTDNNRTKQSSKVFAGNRVVGEVKRGIFSKRIVASRHMLRTPRAIALDVDSLRQAKDYGAHTIRITDGETGRVYSADYEHFMRYSFELDRGHGLQRALMLDRWTVTAGVIRNLPLPVADQTPALEYDEPVTSEPIQYSLFG